MNRQQANVLLKKAMKPDNRADYMRKLQDAREWYEIALSKGRSEQCLAAKQAIAYWTAKLHHIN